MGFYERTVLPRIINVACGMKISNPHRQRACAGLKGQIVEIGFGSGLNVPFYPDTITEIAAIEPADTGWKLAQKRLAQSPVHVERAGLRGESLPFADHSFDAALSTWTLCTIPDVEAALVEVRRVLRPGGTLHFVEHGLSPDEKVARNQHRLNGVQKRVFGGCHLDRPIADLIRRAGFTITELDNFYEKGAPKFLAYDYLGVAVSP
ncbi:MAG: class I SAM-dependent methyltransferase [Actinomycetes bacterium]